MAVNPDGIPRYEQPPDPPERTTLDWMEHCDHCAACQRLYQMYVNAHEFFGWRDEMARSLGCGDECKEYED